MFNRVLCAGLYYRKKNKLGRSLSLSSAKEKMLSLTTHPHAAKFLISDG